jgi:ATP-dependent Clp protease ATP-binding subunit ClpC
VSLPDGWSIVTISPFGSGDPFSDLFNRFFGTSPAT